MTARQRSWFPRAWLISLGILALIVWVCERTGHAKETGVLRRAWSWKFPWCCSTHLLRDVAEDGVMLVAQTGGQEDHKGWSRPDPKLVMWKIGGEAASGEIPLPELMSYAKQLPDRFVRDYPGPFRFGPNGQSIVGLQPPWVLLLDALGRKERRRQLGCQESNGKQHEEPPSRVPFFQRKHMLLAVSPADGSVAIGCNLDEVTVQIFDPSLERKVASWAEPQPLQDIAWSRDGKCLALLYHTPANAYDENGQWDPARAKAPPSGPTVVVYDIAHKRELIRFNTGAFDAKVAFDPTGIWLYSISHGPSATGEREEREKDTLRKFEANTGRLVQRYVVKGTGVRQSFAISPNGKLIAAGTSVTAYPPFFMEQVSINVHAGFVLLDAETGRELARDSRKTVGSALDQFPLFFTKEGTYLVVGYQSSRGGHDYGDVVTYSVSRP